jgi:hypothetical protein
MAYGNVYIFNLYNDVANLTQLNGQGPAGSAIAAPTKGSTSPFYAPQQTVIARTNLMLSQLNSPLFVNEQNAGEVNTLTINYGGQGWNAKVSIPVPPQPRLETDLWLYLAYQQAFLFDSTTGGLIEQPGGKQAIDLVKA